MAVLVRERSRSPLGRAEHAALVRATVDDVLVGGTMIEVDRELAEMDAVMEALEQPAIMQAQIAEAANVTSNLAVQAAFPRGTSNPPNAFNIVSRHHEGLEICEEPEIYPWPPALPDTDVDAFVAHLAAPTSGADTSPPTPWE